MAKIDFSGFWRRRSRLDKLFLALVLIYAALYFTAKAPTAQFWAGMAAVLTGILVVFRVARQAMLHAIWRLRNRLIVAYLFIAVVPLVLIVSLALLAGYFVVGQMAVYLVSRELDHREEALRRPVEALAQFRIVDSKTALSRFQLLTRSAFPDVELVVTGAETLRYPDNTPLISPPAAWKDAHGLVVRDGKLYCWAHMTHSGEEVTAVAPITLDLLASFVPGLGDVNFIPRPGEPLLLGHIKNSHVPAATSAFDVPVDFVDPVNIAIWESPNRESRQILRVQTRLSAVLGIIFGQKVDWGEQLLTFVAVLTFLFFLAELAALIAGIRLSRTITGAVSELYDGTEHVKAGDFDYRVPVKGNDQLAELTKSFNSMTEDLSRLVLVAKEKERLESELAIAREVQAQLFPKNVPSAEGLELQGFCQPARSVSGDYYDFVKLPNKLVFAIGDVAGKGISAALLMATIQSTMRTQLTGTNGFGPLQISTAHLVTNLNFQLYNTTAPEKFATFFLGVYDEQVHTLTYTNAGHLAPMLIRGDTVRLLEPTGTVVGAFPKVVYEERTIEMQNGDLLVAYTDGIVEPENAYGEMYGEQNLEDLLRKFENVDSAEIISRTIETVNQWTAASEPQDDMTMVVARRI
jgi:sigma-B regulation protein RsbU (phosphoserine phosphatase)